MVLPLPLMVAVPKPPESFPVVPTPVLAVLLAVPPALVALALEPLVTLELLETLAVLVTAPALVLVIVAALVELDPTELLAAFVVVSVVLLTLVVDTDADVVDVTGPVESASGLSVALEHAASTNEQEPFASERIEIAIRSADS